MSKTKLIIAILLLSLVLSLFAGCQIHTADVPASSSPDSGSPEPALTTENIKACITEGMTYAEVKEIFGATFYDRYSSRGAKRIWYLEEAGDSGAYLEIYFQHPGNPDYSFEDWCAELNLTPESDDYIQQLSVWLNNLEATTAMIRSNDQTIEVLFGEDYYAPAPTEPTEPTETICPRTVAFFKEHLTPYMTYGKTLEILGRSDKSVSSTNNLSRRIWYLEDNYYLEVVFFPITNQYLYEYLATEPTNPDGTTVDELYYFAEWFYLMEAYRATLYKENAAGKQEVVEVWFDNGNGPFW